MRTLILTAIPTEYKAVRDKLSDLQEIETPDGTIFEKGKYATQEKILEVIIGQCGMGNINSAIYTERAIKTINPSLVFFCGIAGGIKDVKLGDVVVASKIYSYEGLKDDGGLQSRPDGHKCTYSIVQRALHESTTNQWHSTTTDLEYKVFVGPICVGEKVLGDKKSELYKFIRAHYNDSLAVEMESMGFLGAAHSNNCENYAVVRGISDLIEEKEDSDNEGFQEIASRHAADFTFALLNKVWKNIKPRVPKAIGVKLSFSEVLNPDQIEIILEQIKKLTDDMNIELETVTYGSTNLYLKMSEETSDKLKSLIESGLLKKKIKIEPKSFKQYLFLKREIPVAFEFNRFLPSNDNEFKQVYDYISFNMEHKFGEYWHFRKPNIRLTCLMFASYHSDFEFLTANRISIIDSSHNISKGKPYIKALDFVRNEAIHHQGSYQKWASLRSFKRGVKNDNIAIFKSSLNRFYESFYQILTEILDIEDKSILSSISKFDKMYEGAEGYVVINIDNKHLIEFKNADRLVVDRLVKIPADKDTEEE